MRKTSRSPLQAAFLHQLQGAFAQDNIQQVLAVFDGTSEEERVEALTGARARAIYQGSSFQTAIGRHPQLIVELVRLGLPANTLMTNTDTPLGLAVRSVRPDLVEALIALGADVRGVVGGYSALEYCAGPIIKSINEDGERKQAMIAMAEVARVLVAAGADPDCHGARPTLVTMAAMGMIEPALVLVEAGVRRTGFPGYGAATAEDIARKAQQFEWARVVGAAFEQRELEACTAPVPDRLSKTGPRL